jgi:DNA modification methylase
VKPDLRIGRWQDVLADVEPGSVRLILTSPPYDNARTYEGTNEPVDFGELAAFCLRVLMPGGVLAMVLDGAVNDGEQSTTPYRVICEWAAMDGWRFRQLLVYGRDGAVGAFSGGWFRRDHEPLLYFIRDGAPPACNKVEIREQTAPYRAGGSTRRRPGGRLYRQPNEVKTMDTKDRGSVWYYGNIGGPRCACPDHPATFAEAFAVDAVKVWSNADDLVCDPFSGSGTVAVACRGLGRRFVGAERVPLYHEMALRRLDPTHVSPERAAEPVGTLFAGRQP